VKTVRFTQVIKRSGRPRAHTLWLAPDKDPELARARKADRVMTVGASGAAGKTDMGVVGFEPGKHEDAQFLIFPKSLKPFDGARVVGIKFDLIDQPKPVPATPDKKRAAPPKAKKQSTKTVRRDDPALQRELRRAIAELKAGRAIAAHRRLQRAVKEASS
jgi:hypothetical protein